MPILPNPEAAYDRGAPYPHADLDLALIGNSCAAALVDRNARIMWRYFPHFDSNPVFSRLLAGDEEKGFCNVTLAGLAETQSGYLPGYLRNTAIVETALPTRTATSCGSRISRRASSDSVGVPAAANHPDRTAPGLPRITAFGLLSEDIHPDTGRALGQTAAFLLPGRAS